MLETAATIGIGAITVLQVANLWQGRQTSTKLDSMVSKERHDKDINDVKEQHSKSVVEFQSKCEERRENIKKDIEHTNIRVMHHQHNGDGVKITKL